MHKLLRRCRLLLLPVGALVLVAGTWFVFLRQEEEQVEGVHSVSNMSNAELVSALFGEDKELSNQAAVALVYHGRHGEIVASPQTRAVKIGSEGSKHIVVILRQAWSDTSHYYHIVLLDPGGTILDQVWAPVSQVSSDVCDVADPPEQDGAQFIIRASVPQGLESDSDIPYAIGVSGRNYRVKVPRADFDRLGLCRLAVEGHKFKVLHPKMEWQRRRGG